MIVIVVLKFTMKALLAFKPIGRSKCELLEVFRNEIWFVVEILSLTHSLIGVLETLVNFEVPVAQRVSLI